MSTDPRHGPTYTGEDYVALPYAGTQGHAGSSTSQERAEREAEDGTASRRQRQVLATMRLMGTDGATVRDIRHVHGWHHGQASSVLSVLHKTGRIARLSERRERCAVYVLPEFVADRRAEPHGGKPKVKPKVEDLAKIIHGQGWVFANPTEHRVAMSKARSVLEHLGLEGE